MILILNILGISFAVNALRPSLWTILLLSSALCFLVSSHKIDASCQNYKGSDLTRDIDTAVEEMQQMVLKALGDTQAELEEPIKNLIVALFGPDYARSSEAVAGELLTLSQRGVTGDYTIICDDQTVQLERDTYSRRPFPPDPRGLWVDHRFNWAARYHEFTPCDRSRQVRPPFKEMYAYVIEKTLIYVCPLVLDNPKGRSNQIHRQQDLRNQYIDNFMLLPVILLHQILYIKMDHFIEAYVQEFPPTSAFFDPNINVMDPVYLNSLPTTPAFGFGLCEKLGQENPWDAIRNCNSLALYALGCWLHLNDWGVGPLGGFGQAIPHG